MPVEVELKYAADGPEPLARLATQPALGTATLGPAARFEEVDRYLDTADGRFAAARWACRLRRREGAIRVSLKGPAVEGGPAGLHRRPEVEGPAADGPDPGIWPASEARNLVDRLRAGLPLLERFRLDQVRTERAVHVGGERVVGALTLDEVHVSAGGRRHGTLHAVELELEPSDAPPDEALLGELDAALAGVAGLRPDERTKLEHALELIGGR